MMDEITMECRNLHNEELNDLYSFTHYCAGDKIEKNEMGEAFRAYGEGRGVYRVSVGTPEGKRPVVRPRHRWEDNIKMNLQEVGYGVMGLHRAGSA
jgi:hypothetical protein